MATRKSKRTFDIVVFGATGFTGRLVARYLARTHGGTGLSWAIAGRSAGRLEEIRKELARISSEFAELPIIVADSFDRPALDALARQTRVVCTTVGPYALYGEQLVAACADAGTHYCDLTGETPFIRDMIDRYHDRAVETGARIVNCCGFDSIPSDIGTLVLQNAAIERFGRPLESIEFQLVKARGGFSGGTIASLLNVLSQAQDPAVRRVLGNPYSLNPDGQRTGPDKGDSMGIRKDPVTGHWTAPFLMAPINTRVVRRSNALLDYRYGRQFRYGEVTRLKRGVTGMAAAAGMTAGLGSFMAVAAIKPTRKLLERYVLPAPGEGPSEAAIESGFFIAELMGLLDRSNVDGQLRLRVHGKGDPGYGSTAGMLSEAALCLARNEAKLTSPGGVLTPAAAMGTHLIDGLRTAGVTFEVL